MDSQLELMLLGAILADPKLMQRVKGFTDKEMQGVLEGVRNKDVTKLRAWLKTRGVNFPGGKALEAVLMAQNGNRIKAEVKRVGDRLKSASPLSETFSRLVKEWQGLKAEHEAHTTEAKNAAAKLQQPEAGKAPQDQKENPAKAKEAPAQSKQVGDSGVHGRKQ